MEIWKKIEGYDYYEVSNLGRVRSLDKLVNGYRGKKLKCGKILSSGKTQGGYHIVGLTENDKTKTYLVHRLVARAFVDGEDETVNHLDFNKDNNNASNLEWCSSVENKKHYWESSIAIRGSRSSGAKIKEGDVMEIRGSNKSQTTLAREYGLTQSGIHKIVKRKTWRHI